MKGNLPSDRVRLSCAARCNETSLKTPDVSVDYKACQSSAAFLHSRIPNLPRSAEDVSKLWRGSNGLHPNHADVAALEWIFVVDTLNFCFWNSSGRPKYMVEYLGKNYTGYWALCAAVNRALDEGIPLTNPSFYATLDETTASHIFRSETSTPIPLLHKRREVLNEAGTLLNDKYSGSVESFVGVAQDSAQALVEKLVSEIPSFNDSFVINDALRSDQRHRIFFYKRAQIMAADIWACFADTSLFTFGDINSLTMFADYRVPQVLCWLGAIRYSPAVTELLETAEEFPSGHQLELDIRACSVHAVEKIRDEFAKLGEDHINAVLIDFLLWDYAKSYTKKMEDVPIHRVKSIFY